MKIYAQFRILFLVRELAISSLTLRQRLWNVVFYVCFFLGGERRLSYNFYHRCRSQKSRLTIDKAIRTQINALFESNINVELIKN